MAIVSPILVENFNFAALAGRIDYSDQPICLVSVRYKLKD